jgi:hypothetical protein
MRIVTPLASAHQVLGINIWSPERNPKSVTESPSLIIVSTSSSNSLLSLIIEIASKSALFVVPPANANIPVNFSISVTNRSRDYLLHPIHLF